MKINIIIDLEDDEEITVDEEFNQRLVALIRKSNLEDVSLVTIKHNIMDDINMRVPKSH